MRESFSQEQKPKVKASKVPSGKRKVATKVSAQNILIPKLIATQQTCSESASVPNRNVNHSKDKEAPPKREYRAHDVDFFVIL